FLQTFNNCFSLFPGQPGFSLTKAVEDVSQHSYARTESLLTSLDFLVCFIFQATLSEIERKSEVTDKELRSKMREILVLESEVEQLEQQTKLLHDRCAYIGKENAELQVLIAEEEEAAQAALAGFSAYRNKMEAHRAAVLHAASQTKAHKELKEKKELVLMLRQKKEELKKDLENPNGNTVQMAKVVYHTFILSQRSSSEICSVHNHYMLMCFLQREVNALKEEISLKMKTISEKRGQLQKELEICAQIKKDIEVCRLTQQKTGKTYEAECCHCF
uniref:Coiled-coil domain containing 122 n=1 Tax=Amphilophus citrinellus TaxID=61819 RepID=A0A3Q0QU00_AMPCI